MVRLDFTLVGGWRALLDLVCRVICCACARFVCFVTVAVFVHGLTCVGLFWLGLRGSLLLFVFLVRFRCFAVWVMDYNLLCFCGFV